MTKTAFDGNRTSIISKPGKISAETKKGACCYGIVTYSSTGWKSWDKRLLLIGAGRQRQRRQERQRRQTKTEKAGKDREGKKTDGSVQRYCILQRQAGSYRTENRPEIRQAGTLDCYSTCQCPALLNAVFVQWHGFPVRVVSFLRINISLSEPYHGRTVECQTPPCWLWTCRNSRLKLLLVKGGSGEGVGTVYWQTHKRVL